MRVTKKEFRFYTVADWKEEQDYLRKRHQEGWKLTSVRGLGMYHFERCEPEDMVYQLDYNPDGLEHKTEYVQMFKDCGWEYILDFVGYSYFRKPSSRMRGDEEIFCDDASRKEMMMRVFKGRARPMVIIFFLLLLPSLTLSGLCAPRGWGVAMNIILVVLLFLYAVVFLSLAMQYWKINR